MSLLLQALQKASKTRDGEDGEHPPDSAGAGELSLEPVTEPHLSDEPSPTNSATPGQAAAILRASESGSYSIIDRVRDRPIVGLIIAAALFAIGYGIYVYVQITTPGTLRRTPPSAPNIVAAPPAQTPAGTAASAPAKVTGLPAVEPVAIAPSAGPSPVSAQVGVIAPEPTRVPRATAPRQKRQSSGKRKTREVSPEPRVTRVARGAEDLEVVEIPASQPLAPASEPDGGDAIAVRRAPSSAAAVDQTLAAAYAALQRGDYDKAQQGYQQVLVADPRSVDAMLGLAAIDRKQGRIAQAGRHYARVLEVDPRNVHAQAGLIAMVGNAEPLAAESRLKQLIGREPSSFLYFTLGNLYAEQGLWPSAQQAYFQAYQLQTDNPDFAFNLAVGLEHVGQPKLALDYYRRALDLSFRKGHANFDQSLAIQRVGQLSARVE